MSRSAVVLFTSMTMALSPLVQAKSLGSEYCPEPVSNELLAVLGQMGSIVEAVTPPAPPPEAPPVLAEAPAPPGPPPPAPDRKPALKPSIAPNCAMQKIVEGAKKNVAGKPYYNRTRSSGDCALGVRTSLQKANVGGIPYGIGHAVDYSRNLQTYGFMDTGLRDPSLAPPGAVIVLAGENSDNYLSTGKMRKGSLGLDGDWAGHVTIKGDDGNYYADQRNPNVAIGWIGETNKKSWRNVIGIFVPNPWLVKQHEGQCENM